MAGSQPNEIDCALGLAWQGLCGSTVLLSQLKEAGAQGLWCASKPRLAKWGLGGQAIASFIATRQQFDAAAARARLRESGQRFVPFGGTEYPPELCHLSSPPAGLFIRGSEDSFSTLSRVPRITVVGTRKATSEGLAAASLFAEELSRRGAAVLSGMALGIDAQAHKGALEAGGVTVAVLGCGADVVYPARHKWLYDKILREGVVASELPPGSHPTQWTFPHRNRVLAALGDAVLVVEGAETSGALQTAKWALELGRTVYCVPGSIFNQTSQGCNKLIAEGATPALKPELLAEDFLRATRMLRGGGSAGSTTRAAKGEQIQMAIEGGDRSRSSVLEALAGGSRSVDALASKTGLSVREIGAALGALEIAGEVGHAGPGAYMRLRPP